MVNITATEIAEVLLQIRRKILHIVIVILAVWAISFLCISDLIINKIKGDLLPEGAKIVYTYPLEPLMLKLRISLYLGISVAIPYILYIVYKSLKERIGLSLNITRKNLIIYFTLAILLFIAGVLYGYMIMLPIFLNFLYNFAIEQGALAYYTITDFVGFVFLMLLILGFVFEMPLIIYFLVKYNIVQYKTILSYRRHFYIVFFIIGAAITPPDVLTQLMVACPMILFFEFSLFIIKIIYKEK
ncbi:MAG TPA: preprotein translocase subunit TatC [Archaeoglobus profundus]|nr:preprotein translocase subunit TatC [Archaeoglobus profundus]